MAMPPSTRNHGSQPTRFPPDTTKYKTKPTRLPHLLSLDSSEGPRQLRVEKTERYLAVQVLYLTPSDLNSNNGGTYTTSNRGILHLALLLPLLGGMSHPLEVAYTEFWTPRCCGPPHLREPILIPPSHPTVPWIVQLLPRL